MAVRVVTQDTPIIKVVGVSSSPVSSPISGTQVVNVSQSNSIVKVPSLSSSTIEIKPMASPQVEVSNPVVRPFKAIIFQGPKGDPGIAPEGSSVLTSDLEVTETQGSALEDTTYPILTDLEVIVRDMLTEFITPKAEITDVKIGTVGSGGFVESETNEFEYGTDVYATQVTFVINDIDNIYAVNTGVVFLPVQFKNKRPGVPVDQALFPWSYPPGADWSLFLEPQTVLLDNAPVKLNNPYQGVTVIGKGEFKSEVPYTRTGTDLLISSDSVPYYIGKYIRCYTSVSSDLRGSNISNTLGSTANVYDPSNSSLLTVNLGVEANELKFEHFLYDFDSEEREVIISFSGGEQNVSDENRYLIIEIPNEFVIDEAAATTAGSGAYSLNDSIVYLGNSFSNPTNDPYLVNSNHVKYYRSRIPGAFDSKIKLDLKIKLDN